jgi:hypothetical protein
MPYSSTTFSQFKQSLANRLDDPSKVFWSDAELAIYIQDAIRFWNILTGEFREWFDLETNQFAGYGIGGYGMGGYGLGVGGVWYDLQKITGSPRLCSLTDADLYSRLQYAILEPQAANAVLGTEQFQTDDLVQSVQRKRDEFLFRTGCTSSIETLDVAPKSSTVQLPNSVIAAKRGYWLPTAQSSPTIPNPLPRTDEAQQLAFDVLSSTTSSADPYAFSAGVEPPLVVDLYPPPGFPGQVELITYESQAVLDPNNPTTIYIPSDFVPGLMWGALASLLDMNMVAKDEKRAAYARMRFEQYIELMNTFPFILAARVRGIPIQVDAVETLDIYDPTWRTLTSEPSVVGLSGQNLLCFPTSLDQFLSLFIVSNANVPVLDTDPIPLGQEVLSAILDYAQHVAMFKQGAAEVEYSMPMLKSIIELAMHRNAKLRALSTFRDLMYEKPQRENEIAPMEVANG